MWLRRDWVELEFRRMEKRHTEERMRGKEVQRPGNGVAIALAPKRAGQKGKNHWRGMK